MAIIYVMVAVDYMRRHEWGMCVVFGAYALANVGLIMTDVSRLSR